MYWYRRLAHKDFEKIKEFVREGFLPKEISNCKMPLSPCYAQAKQTRGSISNTATGSHIKSGNLRPGDKV